MIIGTILETSDNPTSTAPEGAGGIVTFFTMKDAVTWADIQSRAVPVSGINTWYACTVVINTATGERRWWYNGTEYTG